MFLYEWVMSKCNILVRISISSIVAGWRSLAFSLGKNQYKEWESFKNLATSTTLPLRIEYSTDSGFNNHSTTSMTKVASITKIILASIPVKITVSVTYDSLSIPLPQPSLVYCYRKISKEVILNIVKRGRIRCDYFQFFSNMIFYSSSILRR